MASEPTEKIDQICATPECGKQVRARGFCVSCYYKNLRAGKVESGTQTKRWVHRLTEINTGARTGLCANCGPVKIRRHSAKLWRCAVAADSRSRDYKESYRASRKALLKDKCEICGTTENLCYDHNHRTGEFRGTLCDRCNMGIGQFDDSVMLFQNAIVYLSNRG